MIDHVVIRAQAGNGGNGLIGFRRERFVPKGGPDGGDGGRGGDVTLVADKAVYSLSHIRNNELFKAKPGGGGGGNLKHGANGPGIEIPIPEGTLIFRDGQEEPLAELLAAGERFVAAHGGHGGRGNKHFATSVHKTPRFAERGGEGDVETLYLELRLLADIGLMGLPNAGKSTLLSEATAARAKVAEYAFTTLEPQLGMVEIGYERFVLVDIPGLIEGASEGAGLGDEFLRHLQRTKAVIHLLDGCSEDVAADFQTVDAEVRSFDPVMAARPRLLVVNKIDLDEVRMKMGDLRLRLKQQGYPLYFVSAQTGEGVSELLRDALALVKQYTPAASEPGYRVFRPAEREEGQIVRLEADRFVLQGRHVPRLVVPRDVSAHEHALIVRERLRRTSWRVAIERAGVKPGNRIIAGEVEVEW